MEWLWKMVSMDESRCERMYVFGDPYPLSGWIAISRLFAPLYRGVRLPSRKPGQYPAQAKKSNSPETTRTGPEKLAASATTPSPSCKDRICFVPYSQCSFYHVPKGTKKLSTYLCNGIG
jgi:hypothetical protein